ncbi:MAG: hypothetical protein N2999_07855 [Proteobacteria bacterium]|nr:hypothetical protein [Pseudomonadota bacterium]
MSKEICKKYCPYYKPEKVDIGLCFPAKFFNGLKGDWPFPSFYEFKDSYSELRDVFCKKCEFYPDDCDFNNGSDCLPCGGYIYTQLLLERGLVDIDWIKKVSDNF